MKPKTHSILEHRNRVALMVRRAIRYAYFPKFKHFEIKNRLRREDQNSAEEPFSRQAGWLRLSTLLPYRQRPNASLFVVLCSLSLFAPILLANDEPSTTEHESQPSDRNLPSVQEMIEARTDVWGDAARQQTNGASYEFFQDLLPPLRWVNTEFRHYPLVLSAPRSPQKTRLVSNGSAVNARANQPPMWYEQGVPVTFVVGNTNESFGEDFARLKGPNYLDGYLPIVTMEYTHQGTTYREEALAPVDEASAAQGVANLRFSISGRNGLVEARIDSNSPLHAENDKVLNETNQCLVAFSPEWKWDADHKSLIAHLTAAQTAELAIFTKPMDGGAASVAISSATFDERKQECIRAWREILAHSVDLQTSEQLINQAWRAMLIGSFMVAAGDRLNYSAGNAYAKLYEGECGDTLRSLMLFGHLEAAPGMLKPLLEFNRQATRFHVAGHKLQLLAYFYWLTRDAETIRAYEPLWRPSVELILTSREPETGLLPKDNYAGDIAQQVYSLNSNANCWRGLRDVAAMLDEMGAKDEAKQLLQAADTYRNAILDAVTKSERFNTTPPFIPVALLSDEPAHDPLTATRMGSYYNLISPYVIGAEIFGHGSKHEDWLLGYLQNHGAIAMGMIRTTPHQGQFKDEPGVNPLYGLRYQLALLRRDEREKALVGFYGQLAQGMTRDTFVGGEGSRFLHGDANGRSFYLPPNSTSNAAWLLTLRNLLIQDWDLDEDGKPDTLRLLFAAPRLWLMDSQSIRIDSAPTMFGLVSCRAESQLNAGYVEVHVTPPPRPVKTILLRVPLPMGWHVESAKIEGASVPLIGGDVVDLSGRTKPITVKFMVKSS